MIPLMTTLVVLCHVMLPRARAEPMGKFYERVGGKAVATRRERLWGCMLDEVCYGWPDLAQAVDRSGLAGPPDLFRRRSLRP